MIGEDGGMALVPCSDLSAAGWLSSGSRPWHELVGFGPEGFAAYARLRFIPDPRYPGQRETDVEVGEDFPTETVRLRAVLETLRRHTRTPEDCYFCLWKGWGLDVWGDLEGESEPLRRPRIAPAFPDAVLNGPRVDLPHRSYLLFRGTVADFGDWGAADMWPGQPRLQMPDPAFVWPADHAWCVANDVDPHWAGIGASAAAIDELVNDPHLDVVPADPRESQPFYH